ncbi:hypothetical protein IF1G_08726 [Cordyceps javanica]|uniref:Uncharacterized protein n=1 Tax=Cordyceps javanica TaxID=43265 RepID=A0A545UTK9_9HYPO|nr:hypothetical protein IF1G_08726 [Cordyceps javanica]TQW02117.1 hypothetical protein IF2G_10322 [Cordyceps javanica]
MDNGDAEPEALSGDAIHRNGETSTHAEPEAPSSDAVHRNSETSTHEEPQASTRVAFALDQHDPTRTVRHPRVHQHHRQRQAQHHHDLPPPYSAHGLPPPLHFPHETRSRRMTPDEVLEWRRTVLPSCPAPALTVDPVVDGRIVAPSPPPTVTGVDLATLVHERLRQEQLERRERRRERGRRVVQVLWRCVGLIVEGVWAVVDLVVAGWEAARERFRKRPEQGTETPGNLQFWG